jgi:Malate/lactate dehydrogenases
MKKEIKVVVKRAAGQIGYSLIPRLVDGNTFGDKTVNLSLVEIPQVVSKLVGLAMELDDSYFPNLGTVDYTDNFSEAAKSDDWILQKWRVLLSVPCCHRAFRVSVLLRAGPPN